VRNTELIHPFTKEPDPASCQDMFTAKITVSPDLVTKQGPVTTQLREETFGTVAKAEWKVVQLFIILILCYA